MQCQDQAELLLPYTETVQPQEYMHASNNLTDGIALQGSSSEEMITDDSEGICLAGLQATNNLAMDGLGRSSDLNEDVSTQEYLVSSEEDNILEEHSHWDNESSGANKGVTKEEAGLTTSEFSPNNLQAYVEDGEEVQEEPDSAHSTQILSLLEPDGAPNTHSPPTLSDRSRSRSEVSGEMDSGFSSSTGVDANSSESLDEFSEGGNTENDIFESSSHVEQPFNYEQPYGEPLTNQEMLSIALHDINVMHSILRAASNDIRSLSKTVSQTVPLDYRTTNEESRTEQML
ncbi:hypothetical protein RUND412_006925 [Rhizina undulata]